MTPDRASSDLPLPVSRKGKVLMLFPLLALMALSRSAEARIFPVPIQADSEEDLNSLYTDGVLSEEDLNALLELLNNPINLNRARRDDLYDLPGVSLDLAEAIIKSRKGEGPFQKETDLLRVQGMTADIYDQIAPFVHVKTPTRLKGDLKGKIRVRTVKEIVPVEPLENDTPYKTHSAEQLGYGNWPATYLSARVEYQKWLEAGFLGVGQEGLSDLTYNPNSRQISASMGTPNLELGKVFISATRMRSEAILGSYVAGFGQGLVFDDTSRTHPHGFYPDLTITGEDHYSMRKGLFGVAGHAFDLTVGGGTIDATVIASSSRYDIYQYDVGLTGGADLDPVLDSELTSSPSVFVDGQKIGWVTLPNFYRENILGANAMWSASDRNHLGVTGYFGNLDRTVAPGMEQEDQFLLRSGFPNESNYGAMGLDAAVGLGRIDLYADFAHSFSGGDTFMDQNAYLVKGIVDVGLGEITASLRRYETGFANPHARGVAAADEYGGMRDRDEQGGRLDFQIEPLSWLTTRFFSDLWQNISTERKNLELFGSTEFELPRAGKIMLFADHRDRDLSTAGRGYIYGGEWEDPESVTGGDDTTTEDWGGSTADDISTTEELLDQRGTKNYYGAMLTVSAVPRTTFSVFYKRIFEDTGMYWPTETTCEPWYQIGHYGWFKVKVKATDSTTISARMRYQEDSLYTTTGDRYHEEYLQIDQKLPKRLKLSVRGTYHKDLADSEASWVDPCKDFETYDPNTDEGGCLVDATPTQAEAKKPEGLIWASLEWRF